MTSLWHRILVLLVALSVLVAARESLASISINTSQPGPISLFAARIFESSSSSGQSELGFIATQGSETFPLVDGASTNTTRFSISDSKIEIEFDHVITGQAGSEASSELNISFRSTIDVQYVISGNYTAIDPDGREMTLVAQLGLTGGSGIGEWSSVSLATPNEDLVLGQSGGDSSNVAAGNLVGILRADFPYTIDFYAILRSASATPSGARATGHITLAFVPEPGTAILVGLGLLGLASHRRA